MASISQQIRQAENTIRNAADCQSILFNIELIVNQTVKQLEASIENSLKLNELYGILAKIPTTLDEVIKWIKAQVLGVYFQQLKAAIEQVKEAIECANALVDLLKTVEEAVERLPECFVQVPSIIENSVKTSIDNKIENIVGPSLAKVREISDVINEAVPGLVTIDTSSPEAFLESIKDNPINRPDFVNEIVYDYEKIFRKD